MSKSGPGKARTPLICLASGPMAVEDSQSRRPPRVLCRSSWSDSSSRRRRSRSRLEQALLRHPTGVPCRPNATEDSRPARIGAAASESRRSGSPKREPTEGDRLVKSVPRAAAPLGRPVRKAQDVEEAVRQRCTTRRQSKPFVPRPGQGARRRRSSDSPVAAANEHVITLKPSGHRKRATG